jgi:hypothetical protein
VSLSHGHRKSKTRPEPFDLAQDKLVKDLVLLNHPVRPRQHIRRNRHADLLGGFQIDDELELCRLLHGQIGGLGAF